MSHFTPDMPNETARQLLQQAGLRRTASRVAVLRRMAGADRPLSHAEVAELLDDSGFGAPTVFRCLVDLTDAGLLVRLDLGDHVWRYRYQGCLDQQQLDHPHFVCVDCGRATCLPEVSVSVSGREGKRRGDFGEVTEVVLKGHCRECR